MRRDLLLGGSGWVAALVVALAGFGRGAAPPRDLEARSLRIVDDAGRARIVLDCRGGQLTLHDRPQVALRDSNGTDRLHLLLGALDSPGITLSRSDGGPSWSLQAPEVGKPVVFRFGKDPFEDRGDYTLPASAD